MLLLIIVSNHCMIMNLNDVEGCRCYLIALAQLSKTTKNLGTAGVMSAIQTECPCIRIRSGESILIQIAHLYKQ